MLANSALLTQPPQDTSRLDRQALLHAARRGASLPPPPGPQGEDAAARDSLLEYASFVLEQEAQYCQQ
jgi:hypothetical protein